MACERPAKRGRSLSPWDGLALARPWERDGLVAHRSPEPGRRLLAHHALQPWRHPLGLSPHSPRAAEFWARVAAVVDLDTRRLRADARVLCVEEQPSRPPRPRRHATRPAKPGRAHLVEHESRRAGALTLVAAFAPRPGRVYGQCDGRKRPRECSAFLEALAVHLPAQSPPLHLVCENARAPTGQQVQAWLQAPPRVVLHWTPGHGSWLHHSEPWVSMLPRKRWRVADVASTDA